MDQKIKDWLGFTHQTLQAGCAQPQLQTGYFFPPASKRNVLSTLSFVSHGSWSRGQVFSADQGEQVAPWHLQ